MGSLLLHGLKTHSFILNSVYNWYFPWQNQTGYKEKMLASLSPATNSTTSHGIFMTSCFSHCESGVFDTTSIQGVTIRDAVKKWTEGESVKLIDAEEKYC